MAELKPYRGIDIETGEFREGYYYHGVMTDQPLCLGDCRRVHVIIIDGVFYHVIPESVEYVREDQIRQEEREAIIKWFTDNPPGEWTDKEIARVIRKRGEK
jgi:hypothetical protein